ncbi:putative nucleolar complex protein 4 [Paratrimastix pyriformis]|uniref:Nucleolar complex protein 4 n=1 Tax=Paratrimastix pyriformis TaxID=342808 RepID=A0ABQ8URZ4_9EUKA|nr:putative nucleolar complex protein 4 [Paratrimastix pyriformis]
MSAPPNPPSVEAPRIAMEELKREVDTLLANVQQPNETLQTRSLEKIMVLSKRPDQKNLRLKLITRTVWYLIDNPHYTAGLLKVFASTFLVYDDVQLYTLKAVQQMIRAHQPGNTARGMLSRDDMPPATVSMESFCRNMVALLLQVRSIERPERFFYEDEQPQGDVDLDEAAQPAVGQKHPRSAKDKKLQPQTYGKEFGHAWREFLLLPLPRDVVKAALQHMELNVLPAVQTPLMFAEFLTGAAQSVTTPPFYTQLYVPPYLQCPSPPLLPPGCLSVCSDYPPFYTQLYALLTAETLRSRYLPRFFYLLDIFLSSRSRALPAYMVAAFAKRLGRLAMTSSVPATLTCLAVIRNLCLRHPAVRPLIQKPQTGPAAPGSSAPLADVHPAATGGPVDEKAVPGTSRYDGFLPDEPDLAKCNALQSSLWEVAHLRSHHYAAVAQMARVFEEPLTPDEWDVTHFARLATKDLFGREVTRPLQAGSAPLAIFPPVHLLKTLPPKTSLPALSEAVSTRPAAPAAPGAAPAVDECFAMFR